MGIGPSTKETSLHHFRDPLLEVVSSDPEIDLMGVIIVGTPDADEEKHLVESYRAVYAIYSILRLRRFMPQSSNLSGFWEMILNRVRPILPKPLMPTLIAIFFLQIVIKLF